MTTHMQITMLGGRGVGKTSLLTSMYQQFEATLEHSTFQLVPDVEGAAILSERLASLRGLLDYFESTTGQGIGATLQERSFQFDVAETGNAPALSLHFVDYPGEYHQTSSPEKHRALTLLEESVVVLLAIDTPALMEEDGRWNEMINRTQQMTDLFKKAYQQLQEPRLVIFAPVKCEKYLENEQDTKRMREKLRTEYRKLLQFFASEALYDKVAAVVTPVQTVGNVRFVAIDIENKQPHFYYRRKHPDAPYAPQDCDQPLRYLMRFLLGLHYRQKKERWGILSWLRDLLGLDDQLKREAHKLAQACKLAGAFEILQGERLFMWNE